jgi:thiamine biosynthesis lipoprotein
MSTAASDWSLWSTSARVVVTDANALPEARTITDRLLAKVELASSRFRADSELARVAPLLNDCTEVSPMLAALVRASLRAARLTDGDVDPTLGNALDAVGYDRDIRLIEDTDGLVRAIVSDRPGWKSVSLVGRRLRVPSHLSLDLGAIAKSYAADLVAASLAERLNCGALVSLGGDISTAGVEPRDGWNIFVEDLPGDPSTRVRMSSGSGLATSSTQKRTWQRAGRRLHHILDPRTGLPATPTWRTVTVSAESCATANTLSTASVIRGERAVAWLQSKSVSARLVRADGRIVTTGDWPQEFEAPKVMRSNV